MWRDTYGGEEGQQDGGLDEHREDLSSLQAVSLLPLSDLAKFTLLRRKLLKLD